MNKKRLRLLLIPLDERPVNTSYPEMVAKIAGIDLIVPPQEIQGWKRTPAFLDSLDRWLIDMAPTCDAAIVSCDFLGYGNLINARISDQTSSEIISRLSILTNLTIPVHAFSLITRVSNADDNVEEPLYWKNWGTKFYRYSALEHRRLTCDMLSEDEWTSLNALTLTLPSELKRDWLTRRLRNHTVNLALIELAAKGKLSSLLLTSDDTAAWGFPSRERAWLKSWAELIPLLSDKVEMHPGADEVGTALVARLINHTKGKAPSIFVDYAIDLDKALVAPYEDRPISETVAGQIHACGAKITSDRATADLILGVLTPAPSRKDYRPEYLETDRQSRTKPYGELFVRLADAQAQGIPVILADVAYPNGADPLAMELLFNSYCDLALGELAAYGAWNTAGNTLGVAIAQGVVSQFAGGDAGRELAQKVFLAHRFLEDWAYQTVVRREARAHAQSLWQRQDPDPSSKSEVQEIASFIESRLVEQLSFLQTHAVGAGLSIKPGSTRLPWHRTFEVDFELLAIG
jgi:hypothetical protein